MPTTAIGKQLTQQVRDRWDGSRTSCKPSNRSCCGRNPRRHQDRPAPCGDDARGWGSGLLYSKPCCERAIRLRQMGHTKAQPRLDRGQQKRWVSDLESACARCSSATTRYYVKIFHRAWNLVDFRAQCLPNGTILRPRELLSVGVLP